MPPKAKFTKDEIVNAALDVVRKRGAGALTTRDIARELGVSTRPIFTYFNTMDEVRAAVRDAAEQRYLAYVDAGLAEEQPFRGFGKQYLRFAAEEPQLYRLLFFTRNAEGQNGAVTVMEHARDHAIGSVMKTYHVGEEAAAFYFRDMWIVVHGLATLIVSGCCPYTETEVAEILMQCSYSICKAIKETAGFTRSGFDSDTAFRQLIGED